MTHFLASLVDRARGTVSRVEPVIPSRFAPAALPEIETADESPRTPLHRATVAAQDSPKTQPTGKTGGEKGPPALEIAAQREAEIEDAPPLVPERFRPGHVQEPSSGVENRRAVSGERRVTVSQLRHADRKTPRTSSPRSFGPATRAADISEEREKEAPVVRVTIGRIEVRAAPAPASAPRKPARSTEPALTLDAYLKSRKEGAR